MTTMIDNGAMHQHFIHEEQMDIIKGIRECEITIGAMLESAILDKPHMEIFLSEADIVREVMYALQAKLELKYHTYNECLEGTIDPWSEITPWSSVSDDMEIDGPEIHTQTINYLMSENLQKARDTRREMENNRTKANAEGDEAQGSYEGSTYDQRNSMYDLRVYCRPHPLTNNPLFLENIRILTVQGAPFVVSKDWAPALETVKYRRKIYEPIAWRTEKEKIYTPIKIGHKIFQRRVIWHRSAELKELHYLENKTMLQNAQYKYLLNKYDELNKVERLKPVYKIKNNNEEEISNVIGSVPRTFIKRGGIDFNKSSQLAPYNGVEYSSNHRYSIKADWAFTLKAAFIQRVEHGHVKECTHVSEDKNGKRITKKQVYAVMRMVFSGKPCYVVVFSDIK